VERTRVLVHLVDVSPEAAKDPVEAYQAVRRELALYQADLAGRPEIVVATKLDMPGANEAAGRLEEHLRREEPARGFFRVSAVTGDGLPAVLHAIAGSLAESSPPEGLVGTAPTDAPADGPAAGPVGRRRPRFSVLYEDGAYVVTGEDIERDVVMTDLEHESAVNRLHQRLRRRGVIRALRSAGAKPGAVVRIRDFEFEFVE
jgi:GTP-binding protein